jgi:hypothetical protein
MNLEHSDVESYFNLLKKRGVISSGWKYVGFVKRDASNADTYEDFIAMLEEKKIKIIYSHKTQKHGLELKTSSYVVDCSLVVATLRATKLDDLFG